MGLSLSDSGRHSGRRFSAYKKGQLRAYRCDRTGMRLDGGVSNGGGAPLNTILLSGVSGGGAVCCGFVEWKNRDKSSGATVLFQR